MPLPRHPSRRPAAGALAAAALLLAPLLAGCSGSARAQDTVGTRTWAPADRPQAPRLQGSTLTGARYDTATQRGKVLVVNFWASWCPPCREEAPALQQVATDSRRDGVAFLGIDVRDDRRQARTFAAAHHVSYPSLYDPDSQTLLAFEAPTLPTAPPTTLVIDRRGRVAAMIVGGAEYTTLAPLVRRIAAERS